MESENINFQRQAEHYAVENAIDEQGHYSLDGVSYFDHEVIVASDEQTEKLNPKSLPDRSH